MADGMAIVPSSTLPLTPCTGVCRLDTRGLCEGCLRTIDEIAAWAGLADADKLVIWDRLGERREQIEMNGQR